MNEADQPELPVWVGEVQPACYKTGAFESVCPCVDCVAERIGIRILPAPTESQP